MKIKTIPFLFLVLALASTITSCQQKKKPPIASEKQCKICMADDPSTLDPRLYRDLATSSAIRLLFEGLMRPDLSGKLIPALAENYEVSSDNKIYTFHLRQAKWTNGEPITAFDVEYSWKTILTPQFPAPNANQFYIIKGAKAAREGKIPFEEVGIKAKDASTLYIELENPTPYFLELIATSPFFPINKQWDQLPADKKFSPENLISSGPFKLEQWKHQNSLVVVKNPNYWNQAGVKLDRVDLIKLEENTALQMFEAGALDWAGSPLSLIPADSVQSLKKSDKLSVAQAAGTHWFRFNTEKAPFDNEKMRKAFSYALNREEIVEHVLQGGQLPAMALVPPILKLGDKPLFKDHDVILAKQLFEEALKEMNLTKEQLPTITLSYTQSDRSHKIAQAVQQQWNEVFGFRVNLEGTESKVFFDKLNQHQYQIASGSWFADISDPINFLEVFKSKNVSTNNTQWENPKYTALLDQSSLESDPEKRRALLREAEKIIIDEMPVAPLYFATFLYVKEPTLKNVYFSELGYIDFANVEVVK